MLLCSRSSYYCMWSLFGGLVHYSSEPFKFLSSVYWRLSCLFQVLFSIMCYYKSQFGFSFKLWQSFGGCNSLSMQEPSRKWTGSDTFTLEWLLQESLFRVCQLWQDWQQEGLDWLGFPPFSVFQRVKVHCSTLSSYQSTLSLWWSLY